MEVLPHNQRLVDQMVLCTVKRYTTNEFSGKGVKKKLPQFCIKVIGGCINICSDVLNYSESINIVNQSDELETVMGGIEIKKL